MFNFNCLLNGLSDPFDRFSSLGLRHRQSNSYEIRHESNAHTQIMTSKTCLTKNNTDHLLCSLTLCGAMVAMRALPLNYTHLISRHAWRTIGMTVAIAKCQLNREMRSNRIQSIVNRLIWSDFVWQWKLKNGVKVHYLIDSKKIETGSSSFGFIWQ